MKELIKKEEDILKKEILLKEGFLLGMNIVEFRVKLIF